MPNFQAILQSDMTKALFVAEVKAKPTDELHRFLAGPWTASIFSPEEIEELYQELQRREETEEDVVEMSLD